MRRPLESTIVKKILVYLRSKGAYAEKTHGSPMITRGQPDVISCYKGRYIGLEIKRDQAGNLTDLQAYRLEQIRTAGGIAEKVWSVEQVKEILRKIDEEMS